MKKIKNIIWPVALLMATSTIGFAETHYKGYKDSSYGYSDSHRDNKDRNDYKDKDYGRDEYKDKDRHDYKDNDNDRHSYKDGEQNKYEGDNQYTDYR